LFVFLGFMSVYSLVKSRFDLKIIWVTLFSYYFYYKSSGVFFLLLFFVSITDYFIAHWLERAKTNNRKKFYVFLSVSFHISLLSYFKYFNFFAELAGDLMGHRFQFQQIFLPVGISFYTFQSMSYIIDVYRGQLKPLKRFIDYTFFASFFPQLVAGPIVRAVDFVPQIYTRNQVTREMFGRGVFLIIAGLIKKALISDYISLNFVDRIFDNPMLYTGLENLMGVYGYALQIYCDFSGYSDMAIGIALLMGFHFKANFDSPYQSVTITEFWRRWHISLSSWLKDYLYISLGGNRNGKFRTYVNLFITMLLGGLWHGASLKFIFWGALHGIALAIHKLLITIFPFLRADGSQVPWWRKIIGVLVTFHIVCFGWIFFRAGSFQIGWQVVTQIINSFHPEVLGEYITGYKYVVTLFVIGYLLHFMPKAWKTKASERVGAMPILLQALVITAVIVFVFQIKSAQIQPFIYFQF
jgi:alginate O-acetyltransferase complex protein AlgI